MQVLVRDNDVEQALRVLEEDIQREGVFREMKARRPTKSPPRSIKEKAEAVRRTRKAARKLAQRKGSTTATRRR